MRAYVAVALGFDLLRDETAVMHSLRGLDLVWRDLRNTIEKLKDTLVLFGAEVVLRAGDRVDLENDAPHLRADVCDLLSDLRQMIHVGAGNSGLYLGVESYIACMAERHEAA